MTVLLPLCTLPVLASVPQAQQQALLPKFDLYIWAGPKDWFAKGAKDALLVFTVNLNK